MNFTKIHLHSDFLHIYLSWKRNNFALWEFKNSRHDYHDVSFLPLQRKSSVHKLLQQKHEQTASIEMHVSS